MPRGGARANSGAKRKHKTKAIATVEAVKDLAETLKAYMDTAISALGREAPELLRLEVEQAKQSPNITIEREGKDGKVAKVKIYDKDIARLSQTSRHFLLKVLFDMHSDLSGNKVPMAAEALKELIQIQVSGDLIIEQADVERAGSLLGGQAEGAVVAGTARDIS